MASQRPREQGPDFGFVSDTNTSRQRKCPQRGIPGVEEASCIDPDKPRSEARAWGEGGGGVP